MSRAVHQWTVRLSAAAEADFEHIIQWTSKQFGDMQALVYAETIGDAALKAVASRVAISLPRSFDFFARLGGEEFAVVLPQTDTEGAALVAERLRSAVAETPFQCGDHLIPITVSIGVSAWSERRGITAATPEDVLDLADQRLYVSKRSGRDRVTSTSPLDAQPRSLCEVGLIGADARR